MKLRRTVIDEVVVDRDPPASVDKENAHNATAISRHSARFWILISPSDFIRVCWESAGSAFRRGGIISIAGDDPGLF